MILRVGTLVLWRCPLCLKAQRRRSHHNSWCPCCILLHVIRFVFLTFDAFGRDSDAEENLEDRIATKSCHRVPSYSSIGRSVPIRQRRTRGRFLELLVLPSCGCKFDAAIQEKILQKRDELAQQKAGSLLVADLIRHVICCMNAAQKCTEVIWKSIVQVTISAQLEELSVSWLLTVLTCSVGTIFERICRPPFQRNRCGASGTILVQGALFLLVCVPNNHTQTQEIL